MVVSTPQRVIMLIKCIESCYFVVIPLFYSHAKQIQFKFANFSLHFSMAQIFFNEKMFVRHLALVQIYNGTY